MPAEPSSPISGDLIEVVDAEPVHDPVDTEPSRGLTVRLPRGLSVMVPTRVAQAFALTLTGFAAGALTTVIGKRGGQKRLVRRSGAKAGGKIVGSRSFVVDVHLLDKR